MRLFAQYLGYSVVTSSTKLVIGMGVKVDTSWYGQAGFILNDIEERKQLQLVGVPVINGKSSKGGRLRNSVNYNGKAYVSPITPITTNPTTYKPYVVDIGAHDGLWLSNTFPFINDGYEALLLEGTASTFAKLKTFMEGYRDRVQLVNSIIGFGGGGEGIRGKGEVKYKWITSKNEHGGNDIWWDGTENHMERCGEEEARINSLCVVPPSLLSIFKKYEVPKEFTLLSLDIEWNPKQYISLIKSLLNDGYKIKYLIIEMDSRYPQGELIRLGYKNIGRLKYDEMFVFDNGDVSDV